jgi:hypothetical protein
MGPARANRPMIIDKRPGDRTGAPSLPLSLCNFSISKVAYTKTKSIPANYMKTARHAHTHEALR